MATQLTQLADAVAMMIAGDGEAGSAATVYNLTTLDPTTTVNNLTLRAYIAFKIKFGDSFNMTTMLAREDNALALNLLSMGTANHMLYDQGQAAGFGSIRPINKSLRDGVGLGITDEAPAARIIGFDANRALMRVVENGADITEFESFVRRQTRAVYFSNVEGYLVLTPGAVRILRTDA